MVETRRRRSGVGCNFLRSEAQSAVFRRRATACNGRAPRAAQARAIICISASIIALNADTGEYAWHYQATPGEEWDFDAVQQLVLADLKIDGKPRQVLMQANKNGFFYVLDRKTGALISAKAIVPMSWASGIDMKTGRPIENKEARYSETGKPVDVKPGPLGAHNWQPMAFNPNTGLVYIPAQQVPIHYMPLPPLPIAPVGWNLESVAPSALTSQNEGFLLAWDPVHQREAWRVTYKGPVERRHRHDRGQHRGAGRCGRQLQCLSRGQRARNCGRCLRSPESLRRRAPSSSAANNTSPS